jgi:energy-coupling factor transport system permease protein
VAEPLELPDPVLPDFVRRVPVGPYRSLNPVTKLAIAAAAAIVALGVPGWTGPAAVLATVMASAAAAGVLRRMVPFALATIPLVASILLVNTLLYPGARDVMAVIGPFQATWSGLAAALQATLRVTAFGLSAAVYALTTPTDDLLGELERRGLGRRGAFVVGAALGALPRMLRRAGEVTEAQRARGLDTEGRLWRRAWGIVPLVGPVVFGALSEVEERTMALEARAFSAPGRRTVLRTLPDSTAQRIGRWALLAVAVALAAASLAGVVRLP